MLETIVSDQDLLLYKCHWRMQGAKHEFVLEDKQLRGDFLLPTSGNLLDQGQ